MRKLMILLAAGVFAAGCGDNDEARPDAGDDVQIDATDVDAMPPDAMPPDAMVVCEPREAGAVGGPCTTDDECDSAAGANDGICYRGLLGVTTFPPEGYCLRDNGAGTVCATDGDCGDGNVCANIGTAEAPYRFCMPACGCNGIADACPANQACFDSFNGNPLDKAGCVPGDATAVDGEACAGFYECDEFSTCWNDTLEFPGGECQQYGCTLGDDATCNGGHCVNADLPFTGTTCVVPCDDNDDCRATEGYVCYDPDGAAGNAQNYCRHPRVGDPCATADDCGGASWTCQTDAGFDGGHCTVLSCPTPGAITGCTPGSICHDPVGVGDNYCVDRCTGTQGTQGSCRAGYMCVDTDPGAGTVLGCVPDLIP